MSQTLENRTEQYDETLILEHKPEAHIWHVSHLSFNKKTGKVNYVLTNNPRPNSIGTIKVPYEDKY